MKRWSECLKDERAYAVVEATILFPIIFMIFFGMILMAMYMPTRAVLQRATQRTATALATTQSDTWLRYSAQSDHFSWARHRSELDNVYVAVLRGFTGDTSQGAAASSVETQEENSMIIQTPGHTQVQCQVTNYVVYKELKVTATRNIPVPVNLSFVNFPQNIPVTVSSTAVVLNGDEFVRNMDLVADFVKYLDEKYQFTSSEIFQSISKVCNQFGDFLGI